MRVVISKYLSFEMFSGCDFRKSKLFTSILEWIALIAVECKEKAKKFPVLILGNFDYVLVKVVEIARFNQLSTVCICEYLAQKPKFPCKFPGVVCKRP